VSYGEAVDVRPILGLTDETYDTELTECLTSAYNLVNSIAKASGFSVPFSSPHQNILDFERYVAAWLFRRRRAPPSEADVLWDMAMKFWTAYLEAEQEEVPFKVVTEE